MEILSSATDYDGWLPCTSPFYEYSACDNFQSKACSNCTDCPASYSCVLSSGSQLQPSHYTQDSASGVEELWESKQHLVFLQAVSIWTVGSQVFGDCFFSSASSLHKIFFYLLSSVVFLCSLLECFLLAQDQTSPQL